MCPLDRGRGERVRARQLAHPPHPSPNFPYPPDPVLAARSMLCGDSGEGRLGGRRLHTSSGTLLSDHLAGGAGGDEQELIADTPCSLSK